MVRGRTTTRRLSIAPPADRCPRLQEAVSLYESGSKDEALAIFSETLAVEHSNPTAAAYLFRHKLNEDPRQAFEDLTNLMSKKPLELSHPVEIIEDLLDFFESESTHRKDILNVYRNHHKYILQSLIQRFLAQKDTNNRHVLGDARVVADLLLLDVPEIGLLLELIRQYRQGRQSWGNSMHHIPVELRKLVLKPSTPDKALY